MSNIWYTSDWHFGHLNIAKYCPTHRPWDTVTDMNEGLISIWNNFIAPDDYVMFLGDVCMGKLDETLPIISRLNGSITLVCGNHDAPAPMHNLGKTPEKQAKQIERYIDAGFTEVYNGTLIDCIGDTFVLLSHFPFSGDHTEEDRYAEYRPKDDGVTPLLHGHVHDAWQVRGRQINVGFDAWGAPVHEDTVKEILKTLTKENN